MSNSLSVFDEVINCERRERRLTQLLRDPEMLDSEWSMYLPFSFNDALDIRKTVRVSAKNPIWTQGANFSFSAGDIIYNIPAGYSVWTEALQKIDRCFKVTKAMPATPPMSNLPRHSGLVAYDVLTPNEDKTALSLVRSCAVTQDEFVRILIVGA